MKFIKLILFYLIIFCTQVVAQRDYNWQLGHFINPALTKFELDFSNGNPDTFSLFRPMPFGTRMQLFVTHPEIYYSIPMEFILQMLITIHY
ncbi:MAG: hypothetical protein IPI23_14925 [Bacteroidetes bacterium]|nr:hypothetical protein [Bacteroidota bacterium]